MKITKHQMLVGEPPASRPGDAKPSFLAFPDDGYIALELPNAMIPKDADRLSDKDGERGGMLLRFKSEEGFKAFMVGAMETAALVWPEIAEMWNEGDTKQ